MVLVQWYGILVHGPDVYTGETVCGHVIGGTVRHMKDEHQARIMTLAIRTPRTYHDDGTILTGGHEHSISMREVRKGRPQ
ncbi:hypothetical protein ACIQWR_18930 [Streptomyces sp. NPDC098789]|uniref:hypothetical protein n=1 Tax=Streptomyces sp. NPDC098789 TaxID=3366098 RepID=UPI0038056EE7